MFHWRWKSFLGEFYIKYYSENFLSGTILRASENIVLYINAWERVLSVLKYAFDFDWKSLFAWKKCKFIPIFPFNAEFKLTKRKVSLFIHFSLFSKIYFLEFKNSNRNWKVMLSNSKNSKNNFLYFSQSEQIFSTHKSLRFDTWLDWSIWKFWHYIHKKSILKKCPRRPFYIIFFRVKIFISIRFLNF